MKIDLPDVMFFCLFVYVEWPLEALNELMWKPRRSSRINHYLVLPLYLLEHAHMALGTRFIPSLPRINLFPVDSGAGEEQSNVRELGRQACLQEVEWVATLSCLVYISPLFGPDALAVGTTKLTISHINSLAGQMFTYPTF